MPIKCVIVDDEPIAIRVIMKHLSVFNDIEIVGTFNLAADAQKFIRENEVDLLFLDIRMPRMTGIELLKSSIIQPAVILTTAYREYAVEAYDLDVIDYLVKPISLERIGRAISRYHDRFNNTDATIKSDSPSIINIKTNKELIRLKVNSIHYIESMGDYILIFHEAGKTITRERISHIEEQLGSNIFRVHRRYLIAPEYIESIIGNMVKVKGKQIPIGRTYRRSTIEYLNSK